MPQRESEVKDGQGVGYYVIEGASRDPWLNVSPGPVWTLYEGHDKAAQILSHTGWEGQMSRLNILASLSRFLGDISGQYPLVNVKSILYPCTPDKEVWIQRPSTDQGRAGQPRPYPRSVGEYERPNGERSSLVDALTSIEFQVMSSYPIRRRRDSFP